MPGEGLRGAAGAGRQDAVEHVDAARDRADDIGRLADAHEVARAIGAAGCGTVTSSGREHQLLALADREAADGVAVEADGFQSRRPIPRAAPGKRRPGRCRTARSRRARRTPPERRRPAHANGAIAARAASSSLANGVHSSNAMVMLASERAAGFRSTAPASGGGGCRRGGTGRSTPSSSILRSSASDIT